MHADNTFAFTAAPFFFFLPDKCPDTLLFYKIQIINHTCIILCAVPFIEMLDNLAWKISTQVTIFILLFLHDLTGQYLAGPLCWRFVFIGKPASRAAVFLPEVFIADAAVQPARRDESGFYTCSLIDEYL